MINIEEPVASEKLPRNLKADQVERILKAIDLGTYTGARDDSQFLNNYIYILGSKIYLLDRAAALCIYLWRLIFRGVIYSGRFLAMYLEQDGKVLSMTNRFQ